MQPTTDDKLCAAMAHVGFVYGVMVSLGMTALAEWIGSPVPVALSILLAVASVKFLIALARL